jgi:hypothetical protein
LCTSFFFWEADIRDSLTGLQAPYSFSNDLNSPNLLSEEELNELAADPNANLSGSDSSSSDSDSDQDEVSKANDEVISNENASSGLTVCIQNLNS